MTLDHAAQRSGTLSPRDQDTLWQMEDGFWTGGMEAARATTSTNAVMIFAYPPGIFQGDHIWNHMARRSGWRSVVMAERRVTLCDNLVILSYRVTAEKEDVALYKALCASTYLRDRLGDEDVWLRISHQQTALP